MPDQISPIGVYVVPGISVTDQVFYYVTEDPNQYVMVPGNERLRPSKVYRPPVDREHWVAVGSYADMKYDFALTANAQANHARRIIGAWQHELTAEKRRVIERDAIIDRKAEELREARENVPFHHTPEREQLRNSDLNKLNRIRAVLAE